MSNQGNLFDAPNEEFEAYARHSDPETSHEAAQTVDANALEGVCLNYLRRYPSGLATIEIARLSGIPRDSLSPRMRPLERKGFIIEGEKRLIGTRNYVVWKLSKH